MTKYIINLQLFADEEKTEKGTSKKRKEAREKGQVLQSKEINSALVLLTVFLGLSLFGGYMYGNLMDFTKKVLWDYTRLEGIYTHEGIHKILIEIIAIVSKTVAPIVGIAFVIGLASNYMQVGFLFTTKTLGIKFSRINPVEGFKRVFSKKALVELVKSIFKVIFIGYIAYGFLMKEIDTIMNLFDMSLGSIVIYIANTCYRLGLRIALLLLGLAILDYGYQWWEHEKNLKMSKKEIKEEYKQTEGDPQIKSKVKEKQRQLAMSRMMEEVPKADVIITNPTHYAVAIKYDTSKYDAPYVIAKGIDFVAENIKKVAIKSSITIVENKPIAQALYKTVEIGEFIPEELYQAVAEILAYVYSLE